MASNNLNTGKNPFTGKEFLLFVFDKSGNSTLRPDTYQTRIGAEKQKREINNPAITVIILERGAVDSYLKKALKSKRTSKKKLHKLNHLQTVSSDSDKKRLRTAIAAKEKLAYRDYKAFILNKC